MTPTVEPILRANPASFAAHLVDLYRLSKPRVVALISVTTGVGFLLGSGPSVDLSRLLWTLFGTACAGGGSLALNQLIERDHDAQMERTRRRPLPAGRVEPTEALAFGVALVTLGLATLTLLAHPVAGLVTALTVVMYLFMYTPAKQVTALSTLIGTAPGALPPVTGWAAATGGLGPGAWALFGVLFFWQLPHSLAVARLWRDDYAAAGFKLLPVIDRDGPSTRRQVLLHALALVGAGLLPVFAGIAGLGYAALAVGLGLAHLVYAARFYRHESEATARRLFLASLLYMPALLVALTLDRIPR